MWGKLVRPKVDAFGGSVFRGQDGEDKRDLEWIREAWSSENVSVIIWIWQDGRTKENGNNQPVTSSE